jgi:hypothetical protein
MTLSPSQSRIVTVCRVISLIVIAGTLAWAAEAPTRFARLDLLDGRKLTNVTVRTYDAASGRVFLIADRKAMSVPITLIPQPFAQQFKLGLPAGGGSMTVVKSSPPAQLPRQITSAAPAVSSGPAPVVTVVNESATVDPAYAHAEAAAKRAERFFRFEIPTGSNAISVYDVDIETLGTEPVTGWEGRYRTRGKAYIQYYDSKGNSYSRVTDGFEVITDQKRGGAVTVSDLTRLAHASL